MLKCYKNSRLLCHRVQHWRFCHCCPTFQAGQQQRQRPTVKGKIFFSFLFFWPARRSSGGWAMSLWSRHKIAQIYSWNQPWARFLLDFDTNWDRDLKRSSIWKKCWDWGAKIASRGQFYRSREILIIPNFKPENWYPLHLPLSQSSK